jgi:hypothetical protein
MWRPLQMYLYEWWPLLRRMRLHEKLSAVKVQLIADNEQVISPDLSVRESRHTG